MLNSQWEPAQGAQLSALCDLEGRDGEGGQFKREEIDVYI